MVKVSVIAAVACLSTVVVGQAQPYAQCGGSGYSGPTTCVSGWCCKFSNEWYSQCLQGDCGSNPTTTAIRTTTTSRTTTPGGTTRTTTPGATTRTTTPGATTRTTTAGQPTTTSGGGTCSGNTASTTTLQGYGASARGGSGTPVTVSSCSELTSALSAGGKIIRVNGLLTGCGIPRVPADTSIIGVGSNSGIINGGLYIRQVSNVVVRNLKFSPEPKGDSISIDQSTNVWVDHCEFYSKGLVGGKDDYDGLLDVKERADFITVSYNKFYDHWKGSLVGHSDNNADDKGYLRITYHHNSFTNVNSRLPSLRFGTAHIFSNCYTNNPTSGVNSRMGANALVEQNHFRNTKLSIVTDLDSDLPGFARSVNNIFENSDTRITQQSSYNPPYSYSVTPACKVCDHVSANAGVGKISV